MSATYPSASASASGHFAERTERHALLVIDMQNDFVHSEGAYSRHGKDVGQIQAMIPEISQTVDAARSCGVLVVWLRQTTLGEGLGDSHTWRSFKSRHGMSPDYCLKGTWGHSIVDAIKPLTSEPIVDKPRSSGFFNTNLEAILRSVGITTVGASGCETEGCVDGTIRDAVYRDFRAVVLQDCVASTDVALHDAALSIMRSRYSVRPSALYQGNWQMAAGRQSEPSL